MKKIFLIIGISTIAIASCKKTKDPEPPAPTCALTTANMIGTHKVTAAVYKPSATAAEQDVYNNPTFFKPCAKDDVLLLKTAGAYQIQDLGTVCSPSNNDIGNWSLSGTTLTINTQATTVTTFNCTTLIITQKDALTAGDEIKVTYTRQ